MQQIAEAFRFVDAKIIVCYKLSTVNCKRLCKKMDKSALSRKMGNFYI